MALLLEGAAYHMQVVECRMQAEECHMQAEPPHSESARSGRTF